MVLLNKTMMCGGLVVLSPGSPSQVVCGILIMMFHMLLVLKTAPYIKDSEDWSSFAASLGLTLMYVSALVKMLQARQREEFDPKELSYAGITMDVLPILCVSTVIVIVILIDCGLWKMCRKSKSGGGNASMSSTQVLPIAVINQKDKLSKRGNAPPPPPKPPAGGPRFFSKTTPPKPQSENSVALSKKSEV